MSASQALIYLLHLMKEGDHFNMKKSITDKSGEEIAEECFHIYQQKQVKNVLRKLRKR
jgi:hypothetical protein